MTESLIDALLGREPSALAADVSLALPLTLPRIAGREPVTAALATYARASGAGDADLRLDGEALEGAVLTAELDGHVAQMLAVVSRGDDGLIGTIDMYGRPWPFMALVRERIAGLAPELTDPGLGDGLYVPEGPPTGWIDPPPVPPLADDAVFHSPILTATASGGALCGKILVAAGEIYGEQRFRAVLQVRDRPAIVALFDGIVDGHVLQLAALFGLNATGEVQEIRIFTRPWPITARFRTGMYRLLKGDLGPEFWQGPDPEGPLPG